MNETLLTMETFRTCHHSITELRKRIVGSGVIQYVRQCRTCGRVCSQAIKKEKAIQECGGQPPPFDDALYQQWDEFSFGRSASVFPFSQTPPNQATLAL